MTVIDAHQHLWAVGADPGDFGDYGWLDARVLDPIARTFTEADLEPMLVAAGVDATVMVQSANTVSDTAAMLAVADRWSRVRGIVGWAPLLQPEQTAATIDLWRTDRRLVGVRHLIHDEPDPDWIMQPAVLESLALLADAGLTYDVIGVLPRHLEHAITIAGRLPGLRLVLDHLGSPPIRDAGWQPWADLMAAAAEHPNISVKLSGLGTCAEWETWQPSDLQPYVEHVLTLFGADRVMFGGDWPVCVLAGDYARMWAGVTSLLAGLTDAERARVLGGTATQFYRLPDGRS